MLNHVKNFYMKKVIVFGCLTYIFCHSIAMICMHDHGMNDIWPIIIAQIDSNAKNSVTLTCRMFNKLCKKTNAYIYIHSPLKLSHQDLIFALSYATYHQNEAAVKNLLASGAKPNVYPQGIRILPLTMAKLNGNHALIHILQQYQAKDSKFCKPSAYALASYMADEELLRSSSPDKEAFYYDSYQQNPFFHLAIDNNHINIVTYFLQQPKIQKKVLGTLWDKKTPLHHAAQYGRCAIIQLLLLHDASLLNTTDSEGYTPLHTAVLHKQHAAIKTLLTYSDIKVNFCTENRNSPLHTAIKNNDFQAAQLLISCPDICIYIKNKEGLSPLNIANTLQSDTITNILLETALLARKIFYITRIAPWEKNEKK